MINYRRPYHGFTLIELVIFIVIMGIIATTLILAGTTALRGSVATTNQIKANLLAQQCMDWLIGNRWFNGYAALSCPSTPTGTLCNSPANYTVAADVACTTLNGDSNFKTFTVTVSGNANATLKLLTANYT